MCGQKDQGIHSFSVYRQQTSEPTRECQGMPVLVDQALFCQTEVQSLWEQFPGIPSQGSLSHTLLHNAGWPTRSRFCSSVALLLQQVRHTKQPGNAACRLCQGQRGPPPTVWQCLPLRGPGKVIWIRSSICARAGRLESPGPCLDSNMKLGLPVVNAEVAWTAQSSGQPPMNLSVTSQAAQASPFHLSAVSH